MSTAPAARQRRAGARPTPTVIIAPPSRRTTGILPQLAALWSYRRLLQTLVLRELRVRYKNSALGIAWSMSLPLVQVFAMTVLVGYILSSGPRNLSAHILCGFVPWMFFQSAILDASSSIQSYSYMLKKVYFPREILPLVSICANFVHFLVGLSVFLVYRYVVLSFLFRPAGHLFSPLDLPREAFLLPLVVLIEILLVTGISFFISALNVFYEDVKFIVQAGMTIFIYFLPIMYFAENIFYTHRIPHRILLYHIYLLNPMAWIVTAFNQLFFRRQVISPRGAPLTVWSAPFDYRYFAITAVTSCLVFVLGYAYFNSVKWKFAERP